MITIGDRILVFDPTEYDKVGHDIGDNRRFWMPCTVLRVYKKLDYGHPSVSLMDVEFDHRPGVVSRGHFMDNNKTLDGQRI